MRRLIHEEILANRWRSTLNAFRVAGFDLLLDMVHHRHGSNHNDGRNDLVRVKTGIEGSLPVQRLLTPTT
jgi:hypothetical protein